VESDRTGTKRRQFVVVEDCPQMLKLYEHYMQKIASYANNRVVHKISIICEITLYAKNYIICKIASCAKNSISHISLALFIVRT